jgi:hypothetical protein
MKYPRRSLSLPVTTCFLLLPAVLTAAACGAEAPLPINAGGQASGGTGVTPSGGSAGTNSTAGTGVPSGGTGVTPGGSGSDPLAGTSNGGMSTGGSGGSTSAGTTGGGTGGSGGGTGGGGGDLKETVGGPLNGAMLLGKCLNKTAESVCQTNAGACPGANADPALSGVITTDKMVTLGGDPAKVYTITLHVQGEVESKRYDGGMDQSGVGASPKADGFCVGGTPSNGDAYNVYLLRVNNPKKDYFLNSIQPPGVSNHTTYGIDYTAKIQANGGSMLRLVAADKNCSMIRNCGPQENSGNVCSAPIVLQNVDPVAVSKNPTFNFTQAYDGQWVVMVVTDVTEG